MSVNRFFIARESIRGRQVVLTAEQTHQVCSVLRLSPGDRIIVLDNAGNEYDVTLSTVERKAVTGKITARRTAAGEPDVQLTLLQSLLARDKFELVLQKCTEIGVVRFVPALTERSIVRRVSDIDQKKRARWTRILTEAAEQSGRGRIPQLDPTETFEEAVAILRDFDLALITVVGCAGISLRQLLQDRTEPPCTIALLIGPEGGFTEQEVHLACAAGAQAVSLGSRILRTETAAIVASALVLDAVGDLAR